MTTQPGRRIGRLNDEEAEKEPQAPRGLGKVVVEIGKGLIHGGKQIQKRADEFVQAEDSEFIRDRGGSQIGSPLTREDPRSAEKKVHRSVSEHLSHAREDFLGLPDKWRENKFLFMGCNYVKETEKERKHYLPLKGFASVTLRCDDAVPRGCRRVAVYFTSPYTGFREELADITSTGWAVSASLPDRHIDIVIEYQDVRGTVLMMTGFQLPSVDTQQEQSLALPLVLPVPKDKEHFKLTNCRWMAQCTIFYSVKYDRDVEYSNLWKHQVVPKMYIEPPTAWDDTKNAGNSLFGRVLYYLDDLDVIPTLIGLYDVFFWNKPALSSSILVGAVTAISFTGYFDLWMPFLFLGLLSLFYFGYRYHSTWMERGRRTSSMTPKQFVTKHPELVKWGVSSLWCTFGLFDIVMNIVTWREKSLTLVSLAVVSYGLFLALIFPVWVFLDVIVVIVMTLPGMYMKYPVVAGYIWTPHLLGLWRRREPPTPFVGLLTVTLHTAHSLRQSDLLDTNDPYVAVMVGPQHRRTSAIVKTKEPVWNEPIQFVVFSQNCHVQLWLWDWDRTSGDDFMGEALFQAQGVRGKKVHQDNIWIDVRMRPCIPLDFHLFLLGRVKVSWSLEDITNQQTDITAPTPEPARSGVGLGGPNGQRFAARPPKAPSPAPEVY